MSVKFCDRGEEMAGRWSIRVPRKRVRKEGGNGLMNGVVWMDMQHLDATLCRRYTEDHVTSDVTVMTLRPGHDALGISRDDLT